MKCCLNINSSFFIYFLASGLLGGLPVFGSVPKKVKTAQDAIYELYAQRIQSDDHQRTHKFGQGYARDIVKKSTAFFISQNLAVTTTNGVLEEFVSKRMENSDLKSQRFILKNGKKQMDVIEIVAYSYMEGLALLRVDDYKGPYLAVADSLTKNPKLFMAGYLNGKIGVYEQVGKLETYEHLMVMPINNSFEKINPESLWGAPILNNQGKVVGVNAINKMSYNVAFAIDLKLLNRFLNREKNCERVDIESCASDSLEKLVDQAEHLQDRYAQYIMGILFIDSFKNMDMDSDMGLRQSFKWIERSAEQDYAPAQFILCMMYHYQKGVGMNRELAFYWCNRSASQKFLLARYMLGLIYAKGPPELRDQEQAMLLMGMSAQQGLSYAQLNISLFLFFGESVNQNIETAFIWMSRAVENGLRFAEKWVFRYKFMIKHFPIDMDRIFKELGPELNVAYRKHLDPR